MIQDALDNGILDEKHHRKLIQNIERYAKLAGVHPSYICNALSESCGKDSKEHEWIVSYVMNWDDPPPGIVYVGRWPDLDTRMAGIAGCLVRNFIDARILTTDFIIEERPDIQVALVPNFYTETKWRQEVLNDWLTERVLICKPTILYVESERNIPIRAGGLEVFKR